MNNSQNILQDEEKDILNIAQITAAMEDNTSPNIFQYDLMYLCHTLLDAAKTEALVITLIKCITVYVKKGIRFAYDMINKGVYQQMISLVNPIENNPKKSIGIAIEARNCLMQVYQYKEIVMNRGIVIGYSFFMDNFYKFPLAEQKLLIEATKNLSLLFTNDYCANSFIQISLALTHHDMQIVTDAASILYNCFTKGNLSQLKIVDPIITKYISVSLEVITDIQIISTLLRVLYILCQVSYEYAENLINLPIDFGIIIHNIGFDPRSDLVDIILKIIRQVLSFSTLRKGNDRNSKISKFAFYVQPIIIQFIKQNSGDMNLALNCFLDTLDVYFPILEINDILDAITHIVCSGHKEIKIDLFYKKLLENQKIKESMDQYEKLKIQNPKPITHITDFKSFINASNLHSSSFALSESLQNSILKILKSIKSSELMERTLSTEDYYLIQQSFVKIVNICQKMIIFNTPKPKFRTEANLYKNLAPTQIQISLFDQSGKTVYIDIPNAMTVSICETYFNFMQSNVPQRIYTELPLVSFEHAFMLVNMNNMKDFVDAKSINNDAKSALFNHFLCYQSNKRFTSPSNYGYYKFYYIKSQGKIYSVFDNLYQAAKQSSQLEMIEIPKTEQKPTEEDFMNRSDIIHKYKSEENKECVINFAAFHESFNLAYPTLNLQKRSFDYYTKMTLPVIETSLQILKEIHRLFPNLQPHETSKSETNNDNDDNLTQNIFENKIFGWRLIESLDFKSVFTTRFVTASTFINFPFLFPLEQRLLFLKITSLSHLRSYFTLIEDVFLKTDSKIGQKLHMNLNIDKSHLFEEGVSIFNLISPGSIFYEVKFKDENGIGKGPTQEFFRLFSLEMQRNSLDIWLSDDYTTPYANRKEEKGLFPSPHSVTRPDLFFTLGALCAKAIEMEIALPLHFSPSFFKLIRGQRIKLEEVSSSYSKSIENKEGLIGLTFTMPGRDDIELRNGGKVLITDDGNVDLYADLLSRVLTFDVFCNDIRNEDQEEEEDKRDIEIRRIKSSEIVNIDSNNPPLKQASSNTWRILQKTNSSSIHNDSIHPSLSANSSSSSSSSSVKLRRAVSSSEKSTSLSTSLSSSQKNNSSSSSFANLISSTDNENNNNDSINEEEDDIDIPDEIAEYIQRYSFECCASMFREGFGRIIPWSAMNLFTPEEICTIIEGDQELSLDSLIENVVIGAGYESNSPQILWLFEILSRELSNMEKKLFTRFLTGSDSFGIFGLKSLEPKLTISKSEKGDDALPSTSTCSYSLKIPEYSTKEILKKKLLYAIYECNESFY